MRIEDSQFGMAPVDDPLCYPGQIPGYSYLLVRDVVYPLEVRSARRLLEARVIGRDGDGTYQGKKGEALGDALLRFGVAPLELRHPVLSYGSNAAPAQLARKYANSSAEVVVPAVLGTAHGLDIVYSSHISPYGAVPATLIASPGTSVGVHMGLMDDEQMRVLDETEPNYRRRKLSGRDYSASLESGEALDSFAVYISRHGVLLVDGAPRRPAGVRAEGSGLEAATEEAILEEVIELWNQDHPGQPIAGTNAYLKAIRSRALDPRNLTSWLKQRHATQHLSISHLPPDTLVARPAGRLCLS
jgi:hypothetical protein